MLEALAVTWDVDPILFYIGDRGIRYYGLTWALAIGLGAWLYTLFCRHERLSEKIADSAFWYISLGTIFGSRLGHCLFYELDAVLSNPLKIFYIHEGGMASHGAAIGMLVGLWLFARKNKLPYVWGLDRIVVAASIGGAFVRLGNLMNSEIYGTPTDLPWGFIFVRNGDTVPMHPTQIYEALFYVLTFVVLMIMYYKFDQGRRHPGMMFGVGLIGIFLSRFFVEYIKQVQESWEEGMSLLMGQWLSVPFVVLGVVCIALSYTERFKGYVPVPTERQEDKSKK